MRLHDVANAFNNLECLDGYSGLSLFRGQLMLYDDNKRDSETAGRRVLSLSPLVTIPSHRVVAAAGTRWILGHGNPDDYRGSTIRIGYVVQEAPELSQVRTLAECCLNGAGFTAYAGRAWVKDLAYAEQSSEKTPDFHIHFSSSVPIVPNLLVTFGGRLNLVRSMNRGSGGTLVASCEEMREPVIETAVASTGSYNAATDTVSAGTATIKVVRLRWQSLFSYSGSISPKFEPGDIQIAIAKASLTAVPGTSLTLSDGLWHVQSVSDQGSVWLCRATRHGS